mmetsp:Transcript_16925/g.55148  ORF Transcript_16925/g.55148 Transcript_16925/m.55148 type:complete len:254 (-) Transcript_16925:38-799(-)
MAHAEERQHARGNGRGGDLVSSAVRLAEDAAWERAGDEVVGSDTHDGHHGEAAVLQLRLALGGLLLLGECAHRIERVPEPDLRRPETGDALEQVRVDLARHAATHVVRLLGLGSPLQRADEEKQLQLARGGHGVPCGEGPARPNARERHAVCKVPGEGDAELAHKAADSCGHGNAAVLQLGVTEPHDSLVGDRRRDAERVKHLAKSLGTYTLHFVDKRHLRDSDTGRTGDRHGRRVHEGRSHEGGNNHRHGYR